jgi:spermidine/putrescine transport system substrate-binding protein
LGRTIAIAATASSIPRLLRVRDRELNVYNWDTYIGEETVDDFSSDTSIRVRYDLFASNDELFAKLQ